MASFQDANGRTWHVEIDLVTADEIKRDKGIDLIDPGKFLDNMQAIAGRGTGFLVELCWMFIHRQADKVKVSDEDFGRAMTPAAVQQAFDAIARCIPDFFQPLNPQIAEAMRRVWAAATKAVDEIGVQRLAQLDQELAAKLTELRSASFAGNAPE